MTTQPRTAWVGGPPFPPVAVVAEQQAAATPPRLSIETVQLLDWIRTQADPVSCRAAADHLKEPSTRVLARLKNLHRMGYLMRYETIGNLPVCYSAVPMPGEVHAAPGKEWAKVLKQIRMLWERAPGRAALPELQNLQREIDLLVRAS